MSYGMRSLNFLLEEQKLRECGLLGEKESTNDSYYTKYAQWTDFPAPRAKTSVPGWKTVPHVDSVAAFFPEDLESHSPPPTILVKRTPVEQEGMDYRTRRLWSPTLYRIEPNQLVYFPRNSDHNFMIWANVDLLVHRNDSKLRSFEIRYSTEEHWEWACYQYGTNEYKDLSNLSPSIDCLPPIPSVELASEHSPSLTLPS